MESALIQVVTGANSISLIALMSANILLSVIAAIKNGVFSFRNFGDFVPKRILPYIAWVVVAVLAKVVGEWEGVAVTIYAGLIAMYSTGILAAIKSLTGISIPEVFSEKKKE